jgi:hypothetical protein
MLHGKYWFLDIRRNKLEVFWQMAVIDIHLERSRQQEMQRPVAIQTSFNCLSHFVLYRH